MKILFLILIFISCAYEKKITVDENFLKDCIETVGDKTKCESLAKKADERDTTKKIEQEKLTKEQMKGLELRSDFKERMLGKTRSYVIETLGKPDQEYSDGGGMEYFSYQKKPLTRYSPEHDPDKEIIIVFRRNFVTRVDHVQPDSTPKSDFPFGFGKEKPKSK
jgi:hypothetical protein